MMDTPPPLLRLAAVSKRFGGVVALDKVDWDVQAGEVHCLVGENGCGKSTLIKIISGVYQPDEGAQIEFDGSLIHRLTPAHAKALGIQVIFQDLSLFPNLSVAENIAIDESLAAYLRPVRRKRMRAIARDALDKLQFHLPLETPVSGLSVAERQVVAISRGLVTKARVLFMDEPTASLSRVEVDRLLEIVRRLTEQKIAVVFVSHRLEEVIEVAQRVTVLRDGKKVATMRAADVDQKVIGKLMTGLDFEDRVVAHDVGDAVPVVEVAGFSRRGEYQDISLTLRRGEVVGLIGLLGAGRTELALSLFGMTRPDAGTLKINGTPVTPGSNRDAIAAGIAYLSEDRLRLGLNLPQSVADNMILAVLNRLVGGSGLISGRQRKDFVTEWIQKLSIKVTEPDRPVAQLSGGNQQRVVLAKWLATEPKALILDSPTVGVDIKNKQEIYRIIRELAGRGVAILLISDEASEVMATCDRVLIMRSGRLLREIGPATLAEPGMAERIEEQIYA
jgi:simple sugar transport system ATP-binding protein